MEQASNYFPLRKFSFRYLYYAYVDTTDNLADQIFIQHKIPVKFGKEYIKPDTPYKIILCRIHRKDKDEFLESLSELSGKMLLMGYADYSSFCKNLQELISNDKGGQIPIS